MNRLFLSMCAFAMVSCSALTPSEFAEKFPTYTKSKFYDRARAAEAVQNGSCKVQVAGRKYAAPMGTFVYGDLENGAAGVDEWVGVDRGNAYALNSFEWIAVGSRGATQLMLYFDTMLCN